MDINVFNQSLSKRPVGKIPVYWTNKRTITKRSVLWVGHKCDIECIFCYDRYMKNRDWLDFEGKDGAKEKITKFYGIYGNKFIDFMGGEPTLYPHIYKAVEYAARIGLEPTCITHGLHLSDKKRVMRFKDSGIHDFLISIHGIDELNDTILGVRKSGASIKQRQALENLREMNIPFRFNVTLIDLNKTQLSDIAHLARHYGASIINWIMFNPYFDWENRGKIDFQGKYSDIAYYLKMAINICTENGIESNVRYIPLCQMIGYEKYVYNGYQLPYDHHEWDYNSWYDENVKNPTMNWYKEFSSIQRTRYNYQYSSICNKCAAKNICDGFHKQYIISYGFGEAHPYDGHIIEDPIFFIQNQLKLQYTNE